MPDDPISGEFNPYQAPASLDRAEVASGPLGDWLAHPSASLSRVRSGIGMIYTANLILVGWFFCYLFAQYIFPAAIMMIILGFLGIIVLIVGQCYCLAAPRESGAKGVIYASMAFMGLIIISPFVGASLDSIVLLVFGPIVCIVLSYLLFLVFLLQMARVIGKKSLLSRAKLVLALAIVVASMLIGETVFAFQFPRTDTGAVWYFASTSAKILFFGAYLMLLNDLGKLLRVRRVESEPQIIWSASESQEPAPDAQLPTFE